MQAQNTPAADRPQNAAQQYEPPTVVATFSRSALAADLPEDLTPHMHAVQSS